MTENGVLNYKEMDPSLGQFMDPNQFTKEEMYQLAKENPALVSNMDLSKVKPGQFGGALDQSNGFSLSSLNPFGNHGKTFLGLSKTGWGNLSSGVGILTGGLNAYTGYEGMKAAKDMYNKQYDLQMHQQQNADKEIARLGKQRTNMTNQYMGRGLSTRKVG